MKKNIKAKILIVLLSTLATAANATDCTMTPTRVNLSTKDKSVWICEDNKCVHQRRASGNLQSQVDKMYDLGLTAVSTGKSITITYGNNTASCETLFRLSLESHTKVTSIWLNNY
jgi:hypothetical protein